MKKLIEPLLRRLEEDIGAWMKFSEFLTLSKHSSGLQRPYMLAEIGVNHEGDMQTARELIDLAKAGGADGVKFQTYTVDGIVIRNSPSYWDTSFEKTSTQGSFLRNTINSGRQNILNLQNIALNKISNL